MDMFGPYVSAKALMEAVDEPFSYEVGDRFQPAAWEVFDTIDTYKGDRQGNTAMWTGRVAKGQKNFMTSMVHWFLHSGSALEVYVQLIPNGSLPVADRQKYRKAHDKAGTVKLIEDSMRLGKPPRRFRVYLVGPSDKVVEDFTEKGEELQKQNLSKHVSAFVTSANRAYKNSKQVIAWIDYSVAFHEDSRTGTDIRIEFAGWAVHNLLVTPDVPRNLGPNELNAIGNSLKDDSWKLVMQYYLFLGWKLFREYMDHQSSGARAVVESALKGYRMDYRRAIGKPAPAPPKPKNERRMSSSKVVGSIRSDGSEIGHDVVSADPNDNWMLKADGTYSRVNAPVDQRELKNVPAAPVFPLIDTDHYKVIFGITYNHPLIKPGMNKQTWWYQDENMFLSASKAYSALTGDQANVAFVITEKRGANVGLVIPIHRLKQRADSPSIEVQRKINSLVKRFRNNAAEGQRRFAPFMMTKFGFDVNKAKQLHPERASGMDVPANPKKDKAPGFDPEKWNEYVDFVRLVFEKKLGLLLSAGHVNDLHFDRTDIKKNTARKRHKVYGGEKGEPWALFLIQYLLAHSPTQHSATDTFMIPLNIIRSRRAKIEPRKLSYVKKSNLTKWMRENHGEFKYFAAARDWHFLRANIAMPFPYARMIRPMVILDPRKLESINKKLPPNVQMTPRGYRLDGVEFDAYTMVVAMPPSVAEKEFGLVSQNRMARQLISDPNLVYRLRKGKRGIRGSVQKLNLFSTPIATVGAGIIHPDDHGKAAVTSRARENMYGFDPTDRGVIPNATQLDPETLALKLGEKYSPMIKQHLNKAGNVIRISVAGYEAAGTPEQRVAQWDKFIDDTVREGKETEVLINQVLRSMAASSRSRPRSGSQADDLDHNIQQFVKFVRMDVGNRGNSIRVPQLVHGLKMAEYHAPFGASNFKNVIMTIKAPSPDVAKLLILYRLLRRSLTNKQVGRLMSTRVFNRRQRIFPELHAMILAQWAAAGFPVVKNEDARGVRVVHKQTKYGYNERRSIRSRKYGDHITATMLRVD